MGGGTFWKKFGRFFTLKSGHSASCPKWLKIETNGIDFSTNRKKLMEPNFFPVSDFQGFGASLLSPRLRASVEETDVKVTRKKTWARDPGRGRGVDNN